MLSLSNTIIMGVLVLLSIVLSIFLKYTLSKKNKQQFEFAFAAIFILMILWNLGLVIQIIGSNIFNINAIYFDYFIYISICFLPVAFFFLAITFSRTKISFNKWYTLLFIIPTLSVVLLWTNNLHHLFYQQYSPDIVFGKYFYIHLLYTYSLFAISLLILIKYSIKNSELFSKQAILIIFSALIPIVTNILCFFNIISNSIYITPVTFAFAVIFLTFAMLRFNLLKVTPIALQGIVNKISDSYIVLNDNFDISDFNQTFITTFKMDHLSEIRGKNFKDLLTANNVDVNLFISSIEKVKNMNRTEAFDVYISKIKKHFNVEVSSIIVNDQFLGILLLFRDITQHVKDMEMLKNNQDMLMENERLASLGQLIGGIAHNLKTPIMSIAGAAEGLNDLIKEYDASIDNPNVNSQDHHDIARDMSDWVDKIKGYTEYMSDIITTVKGQAVTLATDEEIEFTIEELIKRVDILMKHELKNALIYLNISMRTDEKLSIHGDANSLVQVINNMISNSIQAYAGKPEQKIDMIFSLSDNNLIISIRDYAGGLPEKVQKKLFKEMITTKGKNGTGLGLYMSYSNIKARFNGDITFETNSEGTTFNIILPL